MTINTPRLQAAIGWLGGRKVKLDDVTIEVKTPFCAVSVISTDGKPIRRSESLLIVAAARCANTGMVWNEERTSIDDQWGGPPILIEPVEGEISLHREVGSPPLILFALDGSGRPKGKGQISSPFHLGREYETVWYAAKTER